MTRRMTGAAWGIGVLVCLAAAAPAAAQQSWVERAVHNFGEPINTLWAEGELSFAADGTMVYCSAREATPSTSSRTGWRPATPATPAICS